MSVYNNCIKISQYSGMNFLICYRIINLFSVISLLFIVACQNTHSVPNDLADKISIQLRDTDPKAVGYFFESEEQTDADNMIIVYRIIRRDLIDDLWPAKKEIIFHFRSTINGAKAYNGWYLEYVEGEYIHYLAITESYQFDWNYKSYQTSAGLRRGIVSLSAMKKVSFNN